MDGPIKRLSGSLAIGSAVIPNRVLLAPMSGVSDRPFRALAHRFGAGLVISEMTASDKLAQGDTQALLRSERAGQGLHVVQLAGREAHWMGEGARAAEDAGADVIDINMGCPARKVTGGYSGSALMRDLDHALTLIEATVTATAKPVTLKMRLGWDHGSLNAPALARRAEEAGIRMVTVHGRTRCQFYNGRADWAAIRAVKAAVGIPVIANGDLVAPEEVGDMLDLSGADGVMIGRGAYGRPWLPGGVAAFAASGLMPPAPEGNALADVIAEHYDGLLSHYGVAVGLRAARKHLGWYLDAAGSKSPLRAAIMTSREPGEVMRLVRSAVTEEPARRAA